MYFLSRKIRYLFNQKTVIKLGILWLGWAVILVLFQGFVYTRFQLARPDVTMDWTSEHTKPAAWHPAYTLSNMFLYSHSAWDSNYYVSIAEHGYGQIVKFNLPSGETLTTDYAFLPFYPLLIRAISIPLLALGYSTTKVFPFCGLMISLLGTFIGLNALYDLAGGFFGRDSAFKTAFYFLVFPSSLFLAQIYTEGLFIGLAFTSLALIERKYYLPAAILAFLATWTRSTGVLLSIPIGLSLIKDAITERWSLPQLLVKWYFGVCVILPVMAYGIWRVSFLGQQFALVEEYYYGRGFLLISKTWDYFKYAFLSSVHPQTAVYYGIDLVIVGIALLSSIYMIKESPGIGFFSLGVILFSLLSGVLISQSRYVIAAPSIYLFLGRLGKSELFDRLFTFASVLLLGVFLILFTFRFWVA